MTIEQMALKRTAGSKHEEQEVAIVRRVLNAKMEIRLGEVHSVGGEWLLCFGESYQDGS